MDGDLNNVYTLKFFLLAAAAMLFGYSCRSKETFNWNAGLSAPKNYLAGGPSVEYYYKGQIVAGASSGVGIDPGWGNISGGYVGGAVSKPVPDSISVSWTCGLEMIRYQGGFKLPREKMIELFQQGGIDPYSGKTAYDLIVTGMAPGGQVTVWLKGGNAITEVCKGRAAIAGYADPYKEGVSLWTSTGPEAREILKYAYLHGLPLKVWQQGEREYNYNIGFSSRLGKHCFINIIPLSKDGSYPLYNIDELIIPYSIGDKQPVYMDSVKTHNGKLPVHLSVQWTWQEDKQWFEGELVLPDDFEDRFRSFNRNNSGPMMVLVMDDVDDRSSAAYGSLYLQGATGREYIMKFRLAKLDNITRSFQLSKYSLPKHYNIPKWEGRIPVKVPEAFSYWQE